MGLVRSFFITILFILFGIGAFVANFTFIPVFKKVLRYEKFACITSKFIQFGWSFFTNALQILGLIKLEINDIKTLSTIRNKIIVCTHPSFVDVLILISLIPKTTCFVKNKLVKNPILFNLIDSIFIQNNLEIEDMIKRTKKLTDLGFNIIIFPMGNRHKSFEKPPVKKGAATIAMKTGKNIVPVKIETDDNFLYKNEPFYAVGKRRVTFRITVLDEIKVDNPENLSEIHLKKEITKKISNALYDTI